MGCLFSKKSKETITEPPKKEYSWDKKKDLKVEDFTLDGLQDRTVVRVSGSIAGQQFIIQNCTNCVIFLLDHMATITIDKCVDCQFILGPVKGSLFLRDCKNCRCLCPCQQFRTRDCSKTDVFLFCQTQPIIEASFKMKFGCYQLHYDGLEQQLKDAGLEVLNNTWDAIYDFTPNPEAGPNWSLVSQDTKIKDIFRLSTEANQEGDSAVETADLLNKFFLPKNLLLKTDPELSLVPMTAGERGKTSGKSCFVALCWNEKSRKVGMDLINKLSQKSVVLIKAKETPLSIERASEIFQNKAFVKASEKGNVIGLEFNGDESIANCAEVAKTVEIPAFVSASHEDAQKHIDAFFSSNEMQMI